MKKIELVVKEVKIHKKIIEVSDEEYENLVKEPYSDDEIASYMDPHDTVYDTDWEDGELHDV